MKPMRIKRMANLETLISEPLMGFQAVNKFLTGEVRREKCGWYVVMAGSWQKPFWKKG